MKYMHVRVMPGRNSKTDTAKFLSELRPCRYRFFRVTPFQLHQHSSYALPVMPFINWDFQPLPVICELDTLFKGGSTIIVNHKMFINPIFFIYNHTNHEMLNFRDRTSQVSISGMFSLTLVDTPGDTLILLLFGSF